MGNEQWFQLTCQMCGRSACATLENAFSEGWDAPPHFTMEVTCPSCLSAPLILGRVEAVCSLADAVKACDMSQR